MNTKSAGKSALVIGVLFVPVLVFVWLQIQCMGMNYQLNELKESRDRLRAENRALVYRLKYLASDTMIEKTARELYGFKTPNASEVCMVKRGKSFAEKLSELMAKNDKPRNKRGS